MGCQVATCFEALKRGVTFGGSGVSIGGGNGVLGYDVIESSFHWQFLTPMVPIGYDWIDRSTGAELKCICCSKLCCLYTISKISITYII